jgi:chromosome segregation ATPase
MSSENAANEEESSVTREAHERIDTLDDHLSRYPPVTEPLSTVRRQVNEYEQAESMDDKQDALDKIEAELAKIRDAIEEEVEQGKEEAHRTLDDIEAKISHLRN